MNELVKIEKRYIPADGNESNTVNARELHGKLGIGRDFSSWVKDQIVRARLVEGQDFIVFPEKGENPSGRLGGRPSKEYYLTLDAAKHIAMVSGCEKGHEIRQYFIDFEKFHSGQPQFYIPKTLAEALRLAADKEEEVQRVTLERDKAIKEKAWIAEKREVTAMVTASAAVRKAKVLEKKLDLSENYRTVKVMHNEIKPNSTIA